MVSSLTRSSASLCLLCFEMQHPLDHANLFGFNLRVCTRERVLAELKLPLYRMIATNSQRYGCLCFLITEIKNMYTNMWQEIVLIEIQM